VTLEYGRVGRALRVNLTEGTSTIKSGWQTEAGPRELGLDEMADRLNAHGRLAT
jgi:hypothetical protein